MFQTVGEVVGALKTFGDFYHPRTNSVLVANGNGRDPHADPFRRGFIDSLEVRTELLRRLASLDERDRTVVMLWYVSETPVREMTARLGISRATLYRLRDRALQHMTEDVVTVRKEATA
jgi:DNA-directed RNA polymerase specialized sigma24 family protein